jgi:phenylalanyl-tRNA synthetase beta chain
VITGNRMQEGIYAQQAGAVDFFDIKGDLEAILRFCQHSGISFERSQHSILHPGQGADVLLNGEIIGFVGGLHPELLKQLDIDQAVFVFEVDLGPIRDAKLPNFAEMSRFPSIRRDISLTIDQDMPVKRLIDEIYSIKNEILQEVFVFDVYTGKEVRKDRKSVALGLILQDFSRTLVDEDVENLVAEILAQLKERCNAVLRES